MSKEHEIAVDEVKAAQAEMARLRPRPGSSPSPDEIAKFQAAKKKWELARVRRVAAARRDVNAKSMGVARG